MDKAPAVIGFGRTEETLRKARDRGAVDRYSMDPAEAVSGVVPMRGPIDDVLIDWQAVSASRQADATASWISRITGKFVMTACRILQTC